MSLLTLPWEKRQVIYAAFSVVPGTIPSGSYATSLFGRIAHHLDKVKTLIRKNNLNARTLFKAVFPDYNGKIPHSLTIKDFTAAYDSIYRNFGKKYSTDDKAPDFPGYEVHYLLESGKTTREIEDILKKVQPVKAEQNISEVYLRLENFGSDVKPGKSLLNLDIGRPVAVNGTGERVFTFKFPKKDPIVSGTASRESGKTKRIAEMVDEQVSELCGPENIIQINAVEVQMTQGGFSGELGLRMRDAGYGTNEHVALTYTLSKAKNGDILIHYSEPKGCALHISADVRVRPDGTVQKGEPVFELKG